jgi:Tol biopolymer transport system component
MIGTAMSGQLRRHACLFAVTLTLPLFAACHKNVPTSASPTTSGSIATSTPASPITATSQAPSTGRIAFVSDRDGANAIYLANADGSGVTRVTTGEYPAWAPGGQQLAFQRGGSIYVNRTDGSGESRVTAGSHPTWSPDRNMLVFSSTDSAIDLINVDGSGGRRIFTPAVWNNKNADYGASYPSLSPDGRQVAFIRTSFDDVWALYVVDVDGRTAPTLLVTGTSAPASWSPDGTSIAFGFAPGIVNIVRPDGSLSLPGPNGFNADWTPTGSLIYDRFTGPPDASNPLGTRMRIFLSTSSRALIPEAVAPVRPDYGDREAVWSR